MMAIAWGSIDDVERLSSDPEAMRAQDKFDRTPWLISAFVGEVDKAKVLLAKGANLDERGRGGDNALMICASRGSIEMLQWLIDVGADLHAVDGMERTALMVAAGAERADSVRLLLQSGADVGRKNGYNMSAMSEASSEEVIRVLVEAGEDLSDASTEAKRKMLGLSTGGTLNITADEYRSGSRPRFGTSNPELMHIPCWHEMVRTGISAYAAKKQFGDTEFKRDPLWCFDRFGMSLTELPDGCFVQIGGEHEDYYDPDFCIFNDIVIHQRSGEFQIMGYPQEVFPPTDFHSATYVDGFIYIMGSLGYAGSRKFCTTPVYRLNWSTWEIEGVPSSGDNPGWIYGHKARLVAPHIIAVFGGKICVEIAGEEQVTENQQEFRLNLESMEWTRH